MSHTIFTYRILIFILLLVLTACQLEDTSPGNEQPSDNEERQSTGSSLSIQHASGYTIETGEKYQKTNIFDPFKNRTDTLSYILYDRGESRPDISEGEQAVPIPLKKIVIFSTTHAAMLAELGAHETVAAIGESRWVVNSEFRRRLESGKIKSLPGANDLAMEQLIALEPDAIILIGQFFNQFRKMEKLRELGINVIINSDWMEQTPLGRAEWIKMMGLLTGKTDQAVAHMKEITDQYNRINRLTENIENKPSVLMNLSFKDQWYVPGGNSYMASLLEDAGAEYPWAYTSDTGGIPIAFEEVYQTGMKTDVWLNPGEANSRDDILSTDRRLSNLKPFKTGEIYNITKLRGEKGGYAFWERGVVNPHEILADITKILHPRLMPDHKLIYYEQID
mgnify:CR=1 FL=1